MSFSKNKFLAIVLVTFISLFAYYQTTPNIVAANTERLLTSTYVTTTTRSTSVDLFCSGKSRNDLIDSDQKSLYTFFNQQMKSSFSIDGNQLIVQAINGKSSETKAKIQSNISSFAMFIGPFALGLLLIIIVSPFLFCCCVCPESCPSKCCRKSQEENYTTLELYWPAVCLVLALLLCIGACVAGFSNSQSITKNIDSNLCSISIILDDFMNGNVTNSGTSFFSGLKQINVQLGYLNGNLSSINTTMATIIPTSTNISTTITRGNTALSDIQKIPNNTNSGGNTDSIIYNTPFTSSSPTGTIHSVFPFILGSSNTGGLIEPMYKIVQASIASITAISQSALHFNNEANNFQSGVSALQTKITQFNNFIVDADGSIYNLLKTMFDNKSLIVLGVKMVYGITIAIASFMLLGTMMVAFCDKTKCRYLIYSSCFILFLIGVIGFFISLVFSIITPITFFGCQFIDYSLSSASNFDKNFNQTISNATFRNYISTCLPTSSGDLLTAIGGNSVNALLNLSNSVTNMNSYNTFTQSNVLLDGMASIKTIISNYQKGNVIDISDVTSIAFLKNISIPSVYSSCAATGFTSDSWIPSTNQNPTYIACAVNGNSAVSSSCTSTFISRGGTCNGCMDTTSVLSGYTTKATLLSDLDSRYSGCSTFNNDLSNIWNNYYKIKKSSFSPVTVRTATAQSGIVTYANTIINTIQPTFTNVINSLKSISSTVTDPKYGLVAGLNCRLIGQDIQRTVNTFCESLFTITYYTRLVVGLASFGILFSLCCGVCTGVRFMKHQIRKLNSADNAGLDDQAVQDITNHNFVIPKVLQ